MCRGNNGSKCIVFTVFSSFVRSVPFRLGWSRLRGYAPDIGRFYAAFMAYKGNPPRGFTVEAPNPPPEHNTRRDSMADILMIVIGTGGILLMAAYAAFCERI